MRCQTKAVRFVSALDSTPELSDLRKKIIKERYVPLLETYERRCFRLAYAYHIARLLVTVGSLVVPALLSIQYTNTGTSSTSYSDPDSFSYRIYWATWVLSLLVTTSNGIVSVFKLDKKYYFIHTTYEQLRSEGWQYVGLTGRYSGHGITPTHQNQFLTFTHHIEKIKMKQVEEEYYKMQEKSETTPPVSAAIDLYPLSPDKPLSTMKQTVPGPVQDTVQSLLQAQEVDLRLLRGNTQALLLSDASSASSSTSASASASASTSASASASSSASAPTSSSSVIFMDDQEPRIGNNVNEST